MARKRATTRELDPTRQAVDGWKEKLGFAREAKSLFNKTARMCMEFYSGRTGFMWDPKFKDQFITGNLKPKFMMTISKAFELVALYGPVLFWKNPQRKLAPRKTFAPPPSSYPPDEMGQLMAQFAAQRRQQEADREASQNQLMEMALNYFPDEQPYGGLALASEMATTEALVKGRGCLWTEKYRMPGSDRVLVGSFYETVDRLLVDPDCTDPTLGRAYWVGRDWTGPTWVAERKFGLKRGSLAGKGHLESAESQASKTSDKDREDRRHGKTFDLISYTEIWSKGGVGGRLSGHATRWDEAFDEVVGDYAYLAISDNVDYPLNAPTEKVLSATDEEVQEMFDWPIPFWKDDEWPVSVLDFYLKPNSAWPIAPIAPGLGELIFLNVMISSVANRVWMTSREIIAYLRSAATEVEETLRGGDYLTCIPLNDVHQDINKVISTLARADLSFDVWRIIEQVFDLFDKRVGLTELVYGLNPGGVASRTATDIAAKQENLSVRPDYMAGKVEEWQGHAADKEKFAAHWYVPGSSLLPLLGAEGAMLWDELIYNADPEVVVREMRATVAPGSARKPSKQRDTQNINTIAPTLLPVLQSYSEMTGDTKQLTRFFQLYGEAIDMDMTGLELGPMQQQMTPEMQQAQQQQMQAEQAKTEAVLSKAQMELQKGQIELQLKQMEMLIRQRQAEIEREKAGMEMQARVLEMGLDQQAHEQEIAQDRERHELDLMQDLQMGRMEMALKGQQGAQQIALSRAQGSQKLAQDRQAGTIKLRQQKQQGDIAATNARKAAAAKPKPKPATNGAAR